jgi:ankyrin repeat protein
VAKRWLVLWMLVVCGLLGNPCFAADEPRESELLNAVKFGHLAKVDELLKAGVPADAEVGRMSALWMAATVGNEAIVERLLAAGATPDRASADGLTPLMQAAYLGRTPVVRRLIAAGANPTPALKALVAGLVKADRGAWLEQMGRMAGDTVMTWLPRTQVVVSATEIRDLLAAAVVPYEIFSAADRGEGPGLRALLARAQLEVGSTAVPRAPDGKVMLDADRLQQARLKAVDLGRAAVVEALLQQARPLPTGRQGTELMCAAARKARLPMIELLHANDIITSFDEPLLAALQDFSEDPVRRTEIVRRLLTVSRCGSVEALEAAAHAGATECVRLLLAAGVPANSFGSPTTPLHMAATDTIVRLLVGAYANVNLVASGRTPLNFHAGKGNVAVVRALLAAGAKPDVGGSSLWMTFHGTGDPDVIRALVAAGADPTLPDPDPSPLDGQSFPGSVTPRQSLLAFAATRLNVDAMNALLSSPAVAALAKGPEGPATIQAIAAEQHLAPDDPRVLSMVQTLLAAGANPIASEPTRHCPALGPAAFYGRVEMVRALLAAGAPVNGLDRFCQTPLSYLASNARMGARQVEIVKALLAAGADPNVRVPKTFDCKDKRNYTTALFVIADHPQAMYPEIDQSTQEVVRVLIAARADVNARGPDGRTPVKAAESHGRTMTADMLRKAGGH